MEQTGNPAGVAAIAILRTLPSRSVVRESPQIDWGDAGTDPGTRLFVPESISDPESIAA